MNTFNQLWGVTTPEEAVAKIEEQRIPNSCPKNLEEQCLDLVGTDVYEILVKGYTEKQWGRDCKDLDPSIITRLPLRFTFDNSYFNDPYQGIPIGGYTPILHKLLEGSKVVLNVDYLEHKQGLNTFADVIVYTGMVDELFNYEYGRLPYRSLELVEKKLDCENYQGNAVVNYTEREVLYTRVIEHKHFEGTHSPSTILTEEYPKEYTVGCIPYYPVNNELTKALYAKYKAKAEKEGIVLGGRIGLYSYLNMDETVAKAMQLASEICK
jgi:UDP-galactopyranose mutase